MSHTTAGAGVLWGAFHGELTTIISVGEVESREVLDKAAKHALVLAGLGSQMATPSTVSAKELRFASGGRILALPSSGGRGFTGNVFLDEFAYQEHPEQVWESAAAVTLLGGKLRVASTPNGIGNQFQKLWTKSTDGTLAGWATHKVPMSAALACGFPVDMKKCWELAHGDQRLFNQLYDCEFLDGALQYLVTDDVTAGKEERPPLCNGWAFAGLDIGRTKDATALYVIRQGIDKRWHVVHSDECKRTAQTDIERMVGRAFLKYNVRRLCVDSSGLGAFPAEILQKKHGRARVEPIVFTLKSKEELATGLHQAFSAKKLGIPAADTRLFADLCSIQRLITDAGNVRYDSPHTEDGHGDRAWALALALHAANKQPTSVSRNNGLI